MRRFIFGAVGIVIVAYLMSLVLSAQPVPYIARTTIGTLRDFPWITDHYGFELGTADSHGLDGSRIDDLSDALMKRGTKAFLILSNGKIVHERYKGNQEHRAGHYGASLAKALVGGSSLLMAMGDGRIRLDDPAWRYIPKWRADPLRSAITVGHLINHSSGIEHPSEAGEAGSHLDGWKGEWWRHPPRRFQIALNVAPVRFPPGTRTSYSNPGFVALAYALAASLRDAPISDIKELLSARLKQPLGIPDRHWSFSYGKRYYKNGLELYLLEGGSRYTARAVARLGQLIVMRGQWQGTTILSTDLVDALSTGHLATQGARRPDWKPVPVLGWWSNQDRTWPHLPRDTLVGAGAGHQVVVVVPSLKLVVVRQGEPLGTSKWGKEYWQSLDRFLMRPLAEILNIPV